MLATAFTPELIDQALRYNAKAYYGIAPISGLPPKRGEDLTRRIELEEPYAFKIARACEIGVVTLLILLALQIA